MNGVSEDLFGTMNRLKREQLAQILYSQAGKPTITEDSIFIDVQDKRVWYYSAVVWAYNNNIVSGMPSTPEGIPYGVDGDITRGQ